MTKPTFLAILWGTAPVRGRKQAEPQDHPAGTPDVLRAVYRELLVGINAERLAAGLDSIEPVQIA